MSHLGLRGSQSCRTLKVFKDKVRQICSGCSHNTETLNTGLQGKGSKTFVVSQTEFSETKAKKLNFLNV